MLDEQVGQAGEATRGVGVITRVGGAQLGGQLGPGAGVTALVDDEFLEGFLHP